MWGGSESKTRKVWQDTPPPVGPFRAPCQASGGGHRFPGLANSLAAPWTWTPSVPSHQQRLCYGPLVTSCFLLREGSCLRPSAAGGACGLLPQGQQGNGRPPSEAAPLGLLTPMNLAPQPDPGLRPLCLRPWVEGPEPGSSGMTSSAGGQEPSLPADLLPRSPSSEDQAGAWPRRLVSPCPHPPLGSLLC